MPRHETWSERVAMSIMKRPGGPYRQRLTGDPPLPPRGTRGWFVAAGGLVAATLSTTPRLVPATVAHPVDMRPVTLPYRVLRFTADDVKPLRDVAYFQASHEGVVAVRSTGEAYLLRDSYDFERQVATRWDPSPIWASGPTSVRGVLASDEGPSCLLVAERTIECAPGRRMPVPWFTGRRYEGGYQTADGRCRIEHGLVLCQGGLASGRVTQRKRPAPIAGSVGFVALGVFADTTCGVTIDHGVRCWGPALSAVPGVSDARAVAIRPELGCVLREGGAVSCWPIEGAAGASPAQTSHAATPVADLPPAVAVAANATATCALDAAGVVRCWGAFGNAWPGHPRAYRARRPLDVALPETADALYATQGEVMCARLRSGEVRCWGGVADAWSDQRETDRLGDTAAVETWGVGAQDFHADARLLGDGRVLVKDATTPQGWSVLGDLPRACALVTGSSHACALAMDGRAWCWGDNRAGQLGLDDEVREGAWTVVQVMRE